MRNLFIMFFLILILSFTLSIFNGNLNAEEQEKSLNTTKKWVDYYKDNYFIFGTLNKLNSEYDRDNEVKFQISFKISLNYGLLETNKIFDLYLIHTQKHFWNLYDLSSPFKEINFKPGLLLSINTGAIGIKQGEIERPYFYKIDFIPIVHESNGEMGDRNRSWNRIITNIGIYKHTFFLIDIVAWYIYPFNFARENKDIATYSGYFEILFKLSNNINDPFIQLDYVMRIGSGGWKYWTNIINIKFDIIRCIALIIEKSTKKKLSNTKLSEKKFPLLIYIQLFHGFLEGLEHYNIRQSRARFGFGFNF